MKNYFFNLFLFLFLILSSSTILSQTSESVVQPWVNAGAEKIVNELCTKIFATETFKNFQTDKRLVKAELINIDIWLQQDKLSDKDKKSLYDSYYGAVKIYNAALSNFSHDLLSGIKTKKELKQTIKSFIDLTDSSNLALQFVQAKINLKKFNTLYSETESKIKGNDKAISGILDGLNPGSILFSIARDLVGEFSKIDFKTPVNNALLALQMNIVKEFKFPDWAEIVQEKISSLPTATNMTYESSSSYAYLTLETFFKVYKPKDGGTPVELKVKKLNNPGCFSLNESLKLNDKFFFIFNSTTPVYLFSFNTEQNHWELILPTIECDNKSIGVVTLASKTDTDMIKTSSKRFPKDVQTYLNIEGKNDFGKEFMFLLFTPKTLNIDLACFVKTVGKPGKEGIDTIIQWAKGEIDFLDAKIENNNQIEGSKSIGVVQGTNKLKSQIIYLEIPRD